MLRVMTEGSRQGEVVIFKAGPGFNWWSGPELMKKPHAEQRKVAEKYLGFNPACFLVAAGACWAAKTPFSEEARRKEATHENGMGVRRDKIVTITAKVAATAKGTVQRAGRPYPASNSGA
jgi:hypothetical protein